MDRPRQRGVPLGRVHHRPPSRFARFATRPPCQQRSSTRSERARTEATALVQFLAVSSTRYVCRAGPPLVCDCQPSHVSRRRSPERRLRCRSCGARWRQALRVGSRTTTALMRAPGNDDPATREGGVATERYLALRRRSTRDALKTGGAVPCLSSRCPRLDGRAPTAPSSAARAPSRGVRAGGIPPSTGSRPYLPKFLPRVSPWRLPKLVRLFSPAGPFCAVLNPALASEFPGAEAGGRPLPRVLHQAGPRC